MRLSAALLVRDEADHLTRCLGSLQGIVDEVVVVDTGSTDESVAVAESFGATVLHRPWDDDFSTPRNLGLDHVTGDWVLYIDADEHLAPTTRAHVEHELADPDERHVAYRIRLRANKGFTPYWEWRMWRNRPDLRFHGVIHEAITKSILEVADREGLAIGHADLLLEHEGYVGDQTRKHRRNLPLLLQQVENDPERTYLWNQIGRIHLALGDTDGAFEAWEHAIDLVRTNGVRESVDCLAYLDLITNRAELGRPDRVLVEEADALFPDNAFILWAGAMDAIARDDHAEVERRITAVLAVDREAMARQALSVNERVITEWAHHARAMARFHLGDHAGAAADFAVAEERAPDVAEYGVKRRLAEARLASAAAETDRP